MSKLRIAINGFGRIGRITLRNLVNRPELEVVAINDLTDNETLAHLFKYDSVHGTFQGDVSSDEDSITVNGNRMRAFSERDPKNLPWADLDIDVVIESTGFFRTKEAVSQHLTAGAKKVVISAPAAGSEFIRSVVMGVNGDEVTAEDLILSNASCTTNCAAPMVKVLDEAFGVESGLITTIHAYTGDQKLQDAPHKDLRRARAAAENIVPTSTGAADAITKIFPHLKGKMGGAGIRVPVPDGSLTELTCVVKNATTVEIVNSLFNDAANNGLKGVLEYTEVPLVSRDILGNPHSCIFDADLTIVVGNMVKIVGWYDNEYGYSARLADLMVKLHAYKLEIA
ncbi:MAG: glyceraldehyde 3-phosphate dehydrogenase [Limisphaerales bacterium]|jgi:glyceraldehyde 3-phosphate dehydrogenase